MSDFTVDQLFRPRQDVTLVGQAVYVRALSDLELQAASRAALAAGGRAIRALKDTESADYLALLEPLTVADDDSLRASVAAMNVGRLQAEAARAIPFTYIPFPEDATAEEKTTVLAQREEQLTALREKRMAHVQTALEQLSQMLQGKDSDWLRREAVRLAQDLSRQAAFAEELAWQSVFLSTETEAGLPYFPDIQTVRQLGRQALDLLYGKFQEVNDLDPLAWKSPSSTD